MCSHCVENTSAAAFKIKLNRIKVGSVTKLTSDNYKETSGIQAIAICIPTYLELLYDHFRSTLKRDDFFAYVYFLNLTVLSGYVSL